MLFILGIVLAVYLIRLAPALGWLFFLVAILGLFGFATYKLLRWSKGRQEKRAYAKTVAGSIQRRVDYCKSEIHRNQQEIQEIRENMRVLQSKLFEAHDVSPSTAAETEKLLEAFKEETLVREAKVNFFESAIKKLETILHNHELSKLLQEKKERLNQFREKNLEEIADLEAFRSDIEYERTYMQTIDELSNRLLDSKSLQHVRAIKSELDKMTRDLEGGSSKAS